MNVKQAEQNTWSCEQMRKEVEQISGEYNKQSRYWQDEKLEMHAHIEHSRGVIINSADYLVLLYNEVFPLNIQHIFAVNNLVLLSREMTMHKISK